MHLFIVHLLLVCVGRCLSCRVPETLSPKIIGGGYVDIDSVPYIVQLRFEGYTVCGGSIISPDWVVTAAHCVMHSSKAARYRLRCGSTWRGFGITRHVSKVIPHKSFDKRTGDYDIALVKVSKPFKIGKDSVDAVALPEEGSTPKKGTRATVSGWGIWFVIFGFRISGLFLRAVDLPIVERETCAELYKNSSMSGITERMICAGSLRGDKDACEGDSGGPLVTNGVLVGVVSFGEGFCGNPKFPGVYADVGYFRKWIRSETGV